MESSASIEESSESTAASLVNIVVSSACIVAMLGNTKITGFFI